MRVAYLDTQVAVWIHAGRQKKLSREAVRVIESHELLLSPMVYLEFDYLLRLKRVAHSAAKIYANLHATLGLTLCALPFATVAEFALENGWTNDPFDRVIAAQARANCNAPLVTVDETIHRHYPQAVW